MATLRPAMRLIAFSLLLVVQVQGGDWPQILGPQRNGVVVDERPVSPWGSAKPAALWSTELGAGFAGPAVVGDRVLAFHRVGRQERVECFAAATGKSLWQTDFPASYAGGVNPDNGPRCVPLVHRDRVVVFGAAGDIHCVALADGRAIWSVEAYAKYQGQEGYFGAGSTPVAFGDKVLVNVGGKNAGIVALDLATGREVWKNVDDRASYSSPTIAEIGGRPRAVFVTRLNCVMVDPETGKVIFSTPFGKSGPTVNAATPLVWENELFLSASYGIGAELWAMGEKPRQVWANDESLSSQYSTAVYRDGFLYGFHGREDLGEKELRCVEARTGVVRWRQEFSEIGHVIRIGNQLLVLTTAGELVLASAEPSSYRELSRSVLTDSTTRALPAFSNGVLYLRDQREPGGTLSAIPLRRG